MIIRCYNEERHIGRLLSGIGQQTCKDIEIILVDSGSTDATLSIAMHFPVRVVHIRQEDFSFGHSLNRGCAAASGDLLVFASAHVYPVYEDWIERLTAHFGDERVGLVYGKQRGDETTRFSEHQVFAKWFPEHSDTHQSHPFCNNANAAVRRSLWKQNPYDETLTGLEDLAWAKQIMASGYRIAYEADAEIVHVHDETLRQIYNRYRREAIALKAIYPEERFGFRDFLHMLGTNVFSDLRVAAAAGAAYTNLPGVLGFRTMQFLGTWRGNAQRGAVSAELRDKFYYPQRQVSTFVSRKGGSGRKMIDYSEHDGKARDE